MDEELKSKVYIRLNGDGKIDAIDGGYTIANVDVDTWTYIDEGIGDKYNLCQSHYLDKPVLDKNGCHNYKYVDGNIVETTEEEKAAEIVIPPDEPTETEALEEALCDVDESHTARLDAIEEALCELSELLSI